MAKTDSIASKMGKREIAYHEKKAITYHKRSVQKELNKQKIKPKAQKLYHAFLKGHAPKEGDS